MLISEFGEFGFIERLSKKFQNYLCHNTVGIGDDCAVMPTTQKLNYVVTTDSLVENVHFIRSKITPFDLGYKSLAVNFSDVAAMGAKPIASFLSMAIPESIDVDFLDQFIDGYKYLSRKYNVPLLGGDTTRSEKNLILNVTAIGTIKKNKARLRSMAKHGDYIFVTGYLGDSAGGLKASMLENIQLTHNEEYLIRCHNFPDIYVNEGIWLASQKGVNAMIDVSDGIASDLKHILKASGKSAEINIGNIPISRHLKEFANKHNFCATEMATSGGEDYVLLLTIEQKHFLKIAQDYTNKFGKSLFLLGTIFNGKSGDIIWKKDGVTVEGPKEGYNHFMK